MNRNNTKGHLKRYSSRSPNFDSGLVAEPLLVFGGRHEHVDPKTGLALYGPYSLVGQPRPPLRTITVGMVGPAPMIADAEQWIQACKGVMTNDGDQPFLYPHFPGINAGHPYQCDLITGDTWNETLKNTDLESALANPDFLSRIKTLVNLYIKAIEVLAKRDPKPHVILCCIPQEVIDFCTVRVTKAGEVKRIKISKTEREADYDRRRGQRSLFDDLESSSLEESREHQNLRRGLKAEAMRFGIPTQLVWPRTLRLAQPSGEALHRDSQDLATRAWNFTTALYHKAGGSPWRLAQVEPGVCFVGISFYREITESNPRLRTSLAQAFTSAGDGYVLRGNSFEWDEQRKGRSPHLDQNGAAGLMREVLDLYTEQNRGSIPSRLVVHKSSRYWEEELAGLMDASQYVPRRDFVALGGRGIQFYRTGDYPPLRGSYVKFSDINMLLYTTGFVPYLRTYPGARSPLPIEILEHHGDSPWNVVLQEILALTKLNWNTADFACREPITIAFSHRVGQILAELPPDQQPLSEYRYYM